MTTEQPEALRIADLFEVFGTNELAKKAGAELRRLHAANLDCMAWYEAIKSDCGKLKAEHEALRKAVIKLHAAKGRHHAQLAACDLFDLCGLKNERPTK
jgi:hypothetical protein